MAADNDVPMPFWQKDTTNGFPIAGCFLIPFQSVFLFLSRVFFNSFPECFLIPFKGAFYCPLRLIFLLHLRLVFLLRFSAFLEYIIYL